MNGFPISHRVKMFKSFASTGYGDQHIQVSFIESFLFNLCNEVDTLVKENNVKNVHCN
jgi:hypothetical protein